MLLYNNIGKSGILVHVYDPSTQGRGYLIQGQCGLHNEILCLTKNQQMKNKNTSSGRHSGTPCYSVDLRMQIYK